MGAIPDRTRLVIYDGSMVDVGDAIEIPAAAHSYEGFRAWAKSAQFPTRGRYAFIDGLLFADLSMEDLDTHNEVKTECYRVLPQIVRAEDLGRFYTDGAFVSNDAADVSNAPDGVFVSWASFNEGRVRLQPKGKSGRQRVEIHGSPDWVMEIVSTGSVTKDYKRLFRNYHQAGIREYWLIDARGRELKFQVFIHHARRFVASDVRGEWRYSPVFGRWFRLSRQKTRGKFWTYTLEAQLTPPTH